MAAAVFDDRARKALLSAPIELLRAFFINLPIAAGVVEVIFHPDGHPIDLVLLFGSREFCASTTFARVVNVPQDEPISSFFGRSFRDAGYPEARFHSLLEEISALIGTTEKKQLQLSKAHGVTSFGFYLSNNYVAFMTESACFTGLDKMEAKEELLHKQSLALESSESRYSRFVRSNIIGVLAAKVSGEIIDCNEKFLDILGYSRSDVDSGKITWPSLTPVEWHEADFSVHVPQLFKTGICGPYQKEYIGKNGDRIPIEIAGAITEYDHSDLGSSTTVCYIIDLRKHKDAERALIAAREDAIQAREDAIAASKAKSNFLSIMSHELRTPLAGILGAQTLLLDTSLDRDQRDLVEASIRSGQGLLSLLGDVLDLSKIEAGRVTLNMAPFDLRQAVEESVMLVGELANRKGLELITYFDESLLQEFESLSGKSCDAFSSGSSSSSSSSSSLQQKSRRPLMVISDMQRLRQIIINLIGNSIKFTQMGGVSIKVSMLKKGSFLRRPSWNAAAVERSPNATPSRRRSSTVFESSSSSFPEVEAEAPLQQQQHQHEEEKPEQLSFSSSFKFPSSPLPASSSASSSSFKSSLMSPSTPRRGSKVSFLETPNEDIPISPLPVPESDNVRRILFEVIDSGMGISDEKQKLLFKAFSQVESNASRRFEGAGLGLSICKSILTLLGGSVGVTSELGSGSTFYFDLPVTIVSEPQARESAEGAQPLAAQEKADVHQVLPDPLASIRCLLVTYSGSPICATHISLQKNNISFTRINADDPDLIEVIRGQEFDVLIICLHPTDKGIFVRLQPLAQEENSVLRKIPTLLVGGREGISSRHMLPGVPFQTIFKPIKESSFLDAIARAFAQSGEVISAVQLEQLSSSFNNCSPSSPPAASDVFLSSPLELYRIANHITDSAARQQSQHSQQPGASSSSTFSENQESKRRTSIVQMSMGERPEAAALLLNAPPIEQDDDDVPPSISSPSSSPAAAAAPSLSTVHILAEDTDLIAKIAKRQIETKLENVQVIQVSNGEQAVEAADRYMREHKQTVPVIWMDIMMPAMDGLSATREIRRLEAARGFTDPKTQSFIVALTADASAETVELCTLMGMSEYVSKPMTVATLLAVYDRARKARN